MKIKQSHRQRSKKELKETQGKRPLSHREGFKRPHVYKDANDAINKSRDNIGLGLTRMKAQEVAARIKKERDY